MRPLPRSARAPILGIALAAALSAPAAAQDEPWLAEDPDADAPAGVEAVAPGSAAPPAPSDGPVANALLETWLEPAASLEERVSRTRRASLELGVWGLDGAARAVLAGGFPGNPLERANAAVRLAPNLPAARIELARALWLNEDDPVAALRAAVGALAAIPHHLEASLWFGGWGLSVIALALALGGWLSLVVAGLFAAPHAAHDLGDLLSRRTPAFARAALFASLALAPLALGQGPLGVAGVLLIPAAAYASGRQRAVLLFATAAMLAGVFPVARLAANTLMLISADPVAEAAISSAQGVALEADVRRLEAAADDDVVAAQALALRARRIGNLGQADAHYQSLLERVPDDPAIANNAANVRLLLGHMESALDLYQRSLEIHESPVVLFNLSQAYGRAFQVEALAETLAHAQTLNGPLVAELTGLQGADPQGFVVDLPLEPDLVWRRVLDSDAGEALTGEIRASLLPGPLGASREIAGAAFLAALLLGAVLGSSVRRSHNCSRCGVRLCPRCDPEFHGGDVCEGCTQLFYRPDATDRALRVVRVNKLRKREQRIERVAWAASVAVPGAAGLLARKPLRSLFGAFCFALAGVAVAWRDGVVPDPLVAGASASFACLGVVVLASFGYAAVVALSLAGRKSD